METAEIGHMDPSALGQDESITDWARFKKSLFGLRADWENQSLPRRLKLHRHRRRHEWVSAVLDRNILRQRIHALSADWREQGQVGNARDFDRRELFGLGRLFQNLFFH